MDGKAGDVGGGEDLGGWRRAMEVPVKSLFKEVALEIGLKKETS